MQEPFLSIVGGGLVAAIITIVFNVYWDKRKQKATEDWEFRRYQANLVHHSIAGLMEAFFSGKSEMLYLTSTLETLLATLTRLTAQADQIVRKQVRAGLTVAELDQRKNQLLEPFQKFNGEQVTLRWTLYEQKAKENHAKAEIHLATLRSLVSPKLYDEILGMFHHLSAAFVWDLPNAEEKLKTIEDATPNVLILREKLSQELEIKLGRKSS